MDNDDTQGHGRLSTEQDARFFPLSQAALALWLISCELREGHRAGFIAPPPPPSHHGEARGNL